MLTLLEIIARRLRFHFGHVSDLLHLFDVVSRSGFENASKGFVEKDLDVSMVGRSFMITGANSGIGKATAMAIAKKGSFYSYINTTNLLWWYYSTKMAADGTMML